MNVEGEALTRYLSLLDALIEAARLNHFYPDSRRVRNVYGALHPTVLHPALRLDARSGLPAEAEVSRVFTDAHLAARGDAVNVAQGGHDSAAARRVLARHAYHEHLRQHPPGEPTHLSLKLRRFDEETRMAWFTVVFDRFDLAEAVFTRYTIQLAQVCDSWKRQQVERVGDDLSYTRNFRNAISRFTSHEAEFAFLLLSDLPGVEVLDVVRGRIGPLYHRGVEMPPDFAAIVGAHDAVLHVPLDRAGVEVARDGCGDPLAQLYRDFLRSQVGDENAAPVAARAQQLGYHVWKERKLCCTPEVATPLARVIEARGGRCVIRALAGAAR